MHNQTREVIKNFYHYFNTSAFTELLSLIDDELIHELNYVKSQGKDAVANLILLNKKHYDEQINDYTLMISDDGHCATTKFTVKGKYMVSDESSIPANGQSYELEVVNYFEIKNNKIIKAGVWFDDHEWSRQVANQA